MSKDKATNQKGFFALDKLKFYKACELSMNTAIAYLVICNGTARDNLFSSWSVNAIETYTGISRGRAKTAVENLIKYKIVKKVKSGKHPRYQVMDARKAKQLKPKNIIWLPSGIVQSVSGENSAIDRIRQTHELMLLRMFIDLYSVQNLADDGGISRLVFARVYKREKIAEQGIYDIYGFKNNNLTTTWDTEVTEIHRNYALTEKEKLNGLNEANLFFNRIEMLISMGLVQIIPHLFDNDTHEGEIIHSLKTEIANAAFNAADTMVAEHHQTRIDEFNLVVPVPRHFCKVAVLGIAQLRYKPKTKLTAIWYQKQSKQDSLALSDLNNILEGSPSVKK